MPERRDELNSESSSRRTLLDAHLSRFVDLYKHHYDLFVKGYVIYLAIASAIATVVFRDVPTAAIDSQTSAINRIVLICLACAISILSVLACVNAIRWLDRTEQAIVELTNALEMGEIHFREAKNFVKILLCVSSVIGFAFAISGFNQ